MTVALSRVARAVALGQEAAWEYEAPLVSAYSALLRSFAYEAARTLPSVALAAAGKPTPLWSKPHEEELGSKLRAIQAADRKTSPLRVEAMRAATTPLLSVVGISFSLTNPFVRDVLLQAGRAINVVDTTRADMMRVLNESWEKGESIPQAAERLREYGASTSRATLIARTELVAIANGGSHAAAQISAQESRDPSNMDGLPTLYKIWLTAEDELVRDSHQDAGDLYGEGNGIPLTDAFQVGDSAMQYPGDPDGSAEEVCNCRCAISYEEGAITAAAAGASTMGVSMSVPDNASIPKGAVVAGEALSDAHEWVAVFLIEGMKTSDDRFIAVDAITWRPLPLTISAQLKTAPEHDDAVVAGRVDEFEKMPVAKAITMGLLPEGRDYPPDAIAVVAHGVFDESWEGMESERLVSNRMLRGVSVELAVSEGELVELPPADGEEYGDLLSVVVKAEIATACILAFPAFAEAQIMTVAQLDDGGLKDATEATEATEDTGAEDEALAASAWRFRVITASAPRMTSQVNSRFAAVDHTTGSMIAVHPTSEQAAAMAQPGGQPPGDLHCTLAFLPDPTPEHIATAHKVAAKVAGAHPALEGTVGGAGYFAKTPQPGAAPGPPPETPAAGATGPAGVTGPAPTEKATAAPPPAPAPANPEPAAGTAPATPDKTPEDSLPPGDPQGGTELHPHVALADVPGLSAMRGKLCDALGDAGVPYAENHDFTPHVTLGYEAEPGTPAVHLAGQPLSFGAITVHDGPTKTDHPLQPAAAVTASAAGAAPLKPPSDWFTDPEFDAPTPFTVTPDGQVFGHIATWGQCHTGLLDACVRPPRNLSGYRMFHLGEIETEEGEFIPVGTLSLDTGHANLRLNAAATRRHYDDTGTAAVDVCAGEDRHGIWIAGAVRPDLSMEQVRKLRASKPSGDWRMVGGAFEMIGLAAVNIPGYPVPRPTARVIAASAATEGRVTALIAAGIDLAPSDDSEPRPAELYRLLDRALPGSTSEIIQALAAGVLA